MNTRIFFPALLATGLACDAPARSDVAAAPPPAAQSAALIPGTPDGDLADWVRDIRAGIASVPDLVVQDRAAAQTRTLDLYVTRQEYAEMYFGPDGRQRATDQLAVAVATAEDRFHELMKLLAEDNPSVDDVRAAVAALDQQQALVAQLWRESGAALRR